jgi:putative flippase GtrA
MPSHARALTRSTLGSLLATASEFLFLPVLIHLLHIAPYIAYAVVQFIATAITFVLNRYWAFEASRAGSMAGQGLRYGLVFGGSLALNTGLPSLLHYHLHLQPVLAFAISQVVVYCAWNYPLNRYFVFRRFSDGGKT